MRLKRVNICAALIQLAEANCNGASHPSQIPKKFIMVAHCGKQHEAQACKRRHAINDMLI
jgi:hypothetical protein